MSELELREGRIGYWKGEQERDWMFGVKGESRVISA